jgi:hypothetical protein
MLRRFGCGVMGLLAGLMAPAPASACKCLVTYSVCNEVAQTNLIFAGTVESIEPAFLDPWNANRLSLLPAAEIMRLQGEDTPASLGKLKEIYLGMYPHMSDQYREELQAARTQEELRRVFEGLGSEGKQARIRVKTVFRYKKDDDDDDDDGDELIGKVPTVWTDASDCGFNFQAGETYLVYADDDEETGQLATSVCHRTARLSDAGADLAYLYYFKNGGEESTRLEGFVTSDLTTKLQADAERLLASVDFPAPDVVVELKSDQVSRSTRADAGGKFIFDGLPEGDYRLTAFDPHFPLLVKQLGFTNEIHLEKKSCARKILTVPRD